MRNLISIDIDPRLLSLFSRAAMVIAHMIHRFAELIEEYAQYRDDWYFIRDRAPLRRKVWYYYDYAKGRRWESTPSLLCFWYRPSFWRYVREHWRD